MKYISQKRTYYAHRILRIRAGVISIPRLSGGSIAHFIIAENSLRQRLFRIDKALNITLKDPLDIAAFVLSAMIFDELIWMQHV